MLTQVSAVVTVSDGLRRAVIDLGVPADHVKTIRQGVDRDMFYPGDRDAARLRLGLPVDGDILVWVGRLVEVKNVELLLSAMATLVPERPQLRLYLIGDGELRGALQARAEQIGLAGNVAFQGPVSHQVLPDWYQTAIYKQHFARLVFKSGFSILRYVEGVGAHQASLVLQKK